MSKEDMERAFNRGKQMIARKLLDVSDALPDPAAFPKAAQTLREALLEDWIAQAEAKSATIGAQLNAYDWQETKEAKLGFVQLCFGKTYWDGVATACYEALTELIAADRVRGAAEHEAAMARLEAEYAALCAEQSHLQIELLSTSTVHLGRPN